MKSNIDIKDLLCRAISGSELLTEADGQLFKDSRPLNSDKEDIVISVLDGANGIIQNLLVNVNIYVRDSKRGEEYIENTSRIRTLSRLAINLFDGARVVEGGVVRLEKQNVLKLDNGTEHVINNVIAIGIANF